MNYCNAVLGKTPSNIHIFSSKLSSKRRVQMYCYKKDRGSAKASHSWTFSVKSEYCLLESPSSSEETIWTGRGENGREALRASGSVGRTVLLKSLIPPPSGLIKQKLLSIRESVSRGQKGPPTHRDRKTGGRVRVTRESNNLLPLEVREEILGAQVDDKWSEGPRLVEGIVNEKSPCRQMKEGEREWE